MKHWASSMNFVAREGRGSKNWATMAKLFVFFFCGNCVKLKQIDEIISWNHNRSWSSAYFFGRTVWFFKYHNQSWYQPNSTTSFNSSYQRRPKHSFNQNLILNSATSRPSTISFKQMTTSQTKKQSLCFLLVAETIKLRISLYRSLLLLQSRQKEATMKTSQKFFVRKET